MSLAHGTPVELIDHLLLVSGITLRAGTVLWVDDFYPDIGKANLIRPVTCEMVACLVPASAFRVIEKSAAPNE